MRRHAGGAGGAAAGQEVHGLADALARAGVVVHEPPALRADRDWSPAGAPGPAALPARSPARCAAGRTTG